MWPCIETRVLLMLEQVVYERLEQFLVPSGFHTSKGQDLQDNVAVIGLRDSRGKPKLGDRTQPEAV